MDAVNREDLIGLLAEALMRDAAFRSHRRHWAADVDRSARGADVRSRLGRASLSVRYSLLAPPASAAA